MPKYYLHICNHTTVRDETGTEYEDLAEARAVAVRGISELIAAEIVAGRKVDLSSSITIEGQNNELLETIEFRQLFVT